MQAWCRRPGSGFPRAAIRAREQWTGDELAEVLGTKSYFGSASGGLGFAELDAEGNQVRPLATEVGFWRPVPKHTDGTNVELLLTHPTGFVEMYAGIAEPAKVELRTDGVMRSPTAKEYTAGHRMYGYVNSDLLWVMDMAAVGQPIQSHVSAELKRVE